MENDIEVSDIELDITREILNIGLAKVADSLAAIAKESVLVNVPNVWLVNPDDLNEILPASNPTDTVVQSNINGDISGQTFLIFSQNQAKNIAGVCIGCEDDFEGNYGAMEKSLLLEISNMLTGALVTQLANLLNLKLHGAPPIIVPYRDRKTFQELIVNLHVFKPFILTVKTEFVNSGQIAEMPLLVVFDGLTLERLINAIRKKTDNSEKVITK